jgi:O-acetyl-ADP-ribose deacetylase (regulator of RNase III)
MLKKVSGDIMLSKAQVVAHGVAPGDHFDQGLALSLRKDYPAMVKDFRHYCQVNHPKPGELWVWAGAEGVRIVNLLTQEAAPSKKGHPGKASTQSVSAALKKLRELIEEENFESVALPRLATGVGGLDWTDVLPLMEQHLGDLKQPVYVYEEYHAGVAAKE